MVAMRIGPARLAARDQGRQSLERRARAPVAVKQNLKCPGPDIFAPQEPQPVEALAVIEGGERFRASGAPSINPSRIRDSVPARSREILARCLAHKKIAMTPNSEGSAGLAHEPQERTGVERARRERGGRRVAGEEGDRQPDDGEGETRRPGGGKKAAQKGRDPLAARNPIQTGNKWPKKAPSAAKSMGVPGAKWATVKTATVPFRRSRRRVSAAKSLRPVRKTLVAPILPEPMARKSMVPADRVKTRPNGIAPQT